MEQPIELRKTVTVVFCDVVASTELGGRLDPESLRRLMSTYFAEAAAILGAHGGTVEKFVGDEVMAVFGVPAVRHDDALRAVRAAAELRERLPRLGLPEWDARLQVRIGVNTGAVVAGDASTGHGFVTGDAVNVGKRLEQAAAPGEVLLGAETHALVAHAVDAEPLAPVAAKGKPDGLAAFRLVRVHPDAQPLPPREDVPLVGRDAELRRLLARYGLAAGGQGAQLVTVAGEPGIGKSRLVRELLARVAPEATVAVGRCRAYGEGLSFWPLRELLAAAGADTAAVEGTGHEVFAAVRRAFSALAAERPLVAVLDDIHWAEPALLDLVEHLAARLGSARILLVCLTRPDLEERRPEWLRDAVVLRPLARPESEDLLAALGAPPAVRARIARAADGNPLFVEQLAAAAGELGGETLPRSIRGLLDERLDRLARDERAVLERAAVAGRDFSLEDVVHLSPPELRDRAPSRLLALCRRELLAADPGSDDGFRFRHALIRDAAYDGMPKVLRAELHARMADRLDAAGAAAALVGYHLERAYRHRRELGRIDEETAAVGAQAAERLAEAADAAFARLDLVAAASLLQRSAALLPRDDARYPALLARLGYALNKTGRFDEAQAVLDDAVAAARARTDRAVELRAEVERQFSRSFMAPRAAAEENVRLALAAIPELEALGDELGLAKAWWLKSEGDVFACRWRERAEALEHALRHARAAASLDEASTISGVLAQALLYGPTPVAAAIDRCRALLDEAGADEGLRALIRVSLAGLLAMEGDFAGARELYGRATAVYDEFELRLRRAVAGLVGAQIELLAGDAAAAEEELRRARETADALGAVGLAASLTAVLADVVLALGHVEEAAALSRDVAESAPDDDLFPQVLRRAVDARLRARAGAVDEADALADEALRLTADVEFPELRVSALVAAAEADAAADRADAAAHLREAREVMAAKGNVAFVAQLDRTLAGGVGASRPTK